MGQPAIISFLNSDIEEKKTVQQYSELKFLHGLRKDFIKNPSDFVIVVEPENLKMLKEVNETVFKYLKGILVKNSAEAMALLPILLKDVKLSSKFLKLFSDYSSEVLERISWAWSAEGQSELIADAKLVGDELFVQSCDFQRYLIPVKNIKALSKVGSDDISNFEIDKQGSYLYWPQYDIHLDLEALRVASDPELKAKIKAKSIAYDERYGEAIKNIRRKYNLNQDDFEISDKQIRRYEHGAQRPTFKSYKIMASAHGLSVEKYLEELNDEFSRLKN